MKKRCLGLFLENRLCRYLRWFGRFYRDPFIPSHPIRYREMLDAFAVFGISLLFSALWFMVLVRAGLSASIGFADVIHPFFGALLMLQSALVYGVVFGFSLQAVGSALTMRFFLRLILHSVRLHAMMMPLAASFFFILLVWMIDDFAEQVPAYRFWWAVLLISAWMLWLQFVILVRPVARHLGMTRSRKKSVLLAVSAFIVAMACMQLATVPYSQKVFDRNRFFHRMADAMYADGKIDALRRDALRQKASSLPMFGAAPRMNP